jgi:hypothetical protein
MRAITAKLKLVPCALHWMASGVVDQMRMTPRCRFSIGCSPELREDEGSQILSTSLGGPDEQS